MVFIFEIQMNTEPTLIEIELMIKVCPSLELSNFLLQKKEEKTYNEFEYLN